MNKQALLQNAKQKEWITDEKSTSQVVKNWKLKWGIVGTHQMKVFKIKNVCFEKALFSGLKGMGKCDFSHTEKGYLLVPPFAQNSENPPEEQKNVFVLCYLSELILKRLPEIVI